MNYLRGWTSRPLLLLVAAVCTPSCTSDDGPVVWGGTVLDSAGIRVVHNPEEGLWCEGEAWTITEGLTIGADVEDPTYEFGKISGIQVAADGLIFVFDQMASEIRVFDGEGSHVRTIGGRGQGPGEFSSGAAGLFLMDDGRLTVPDLGNGRINWMSPSGEFLRSAAASYAGGFPVRWDSDGGGSIVVQRRAMGFNEDPELNAGDPLVRITPNGEEETLVVLPKAKTVWMEGAAPRFKYFETEPSWDLGPSGTLRTAMTQEYRIEVRGGDGALRSIITRPSPPHPVTSEDRDRFRHLLREALARMDLSPNSIDRQIENLSFGATFPAFNQLMEGPEGTMLVQGIDDLDDIEALDLSEEMSRRLGSRTWEVFDPGGRFLGTIGLPSRFTPMVWQPAAVYGRWLDELDRAHVLKLNLTRNGEPSSSSCR